MATAFNSISAPGVTTAAATSAKGRKVLPGRDEAFRSHLKDYAPEELADGVALFHEHMQLALDFNARFAAATAAARAVNGLPPLPGRGGAGRGSQDIMHDVDLISAEVAKPGATAARIVDAGHADMGRNIDFLRQVSMKSCVPIVAGGGFYPQPFYPRFIRRRSPQ
jgi:predicted metal-dependent phosphotriesterase family hydrolase